MNEAATGYRAKTGKRVLRVCPGRRGRLEPGVHRVLQGLVEHQDQQVPGDHRAFQERRVYLDLQDRPDLPDPRPLALKTVRRKTCCCPTVSLTLDWFLLRDLRDLRDPQDPQEPEAQPDRQALSDKVESQVPPVYQDRRDQRESEEREDLWGIQEREASKESRVTRGRRVSQGRKVFRGTAYTKSVRP